ncbi:MAG: isoprenyl transferase [candidate division KSB1 bacterium]|nr:isoprenyl transferase [candidate division KSB1 bacterium]MDZ7275267.1 isoprenyl transferase [candidate division KSB1 bacterium]MDZ7287435.1 isoprenyl transferase [candidate division KSB1 bacterium]MDZ7299549.1 isoprenyl transferase [candidate division KSB1 bacterium]MDZ7308007.1 isoprenyl transferase [candidate division KSB1 bacterium]
MNAEDKQDGFHQANWRGSEDSKEDQEVWDEYIKRLKRGPLPEHVAIIMDGNGRWAKLRNRPRVYGHREGINSVREIVRASGELGIRYLTLYTFSTENWRRPKSEVAALMSLLVKTIREEIEELNRNNVRLMTIGHLHDLPYVARAGMEHAMRALSKNTGLTLNLALSYSSRQELTDAMRRIAAEVKAGRLNPSAIDDALIQSFLYTSELPDPDLLIRTSGELRVSNFLLWQLAYTEIYVTEVLWPDFRRREFYEALLSYQRRERRFGRVSEQIISAGHEPHGMPAAPFAAAPVPLDLE